MKRSGIRRLFSLSLRRDRWADEVEEEILTHLTIRAERLQALGMSPQAARDEAVRRFGALEASRAAMIEAATHREEYMRRREAFAELRQDMSFAFRSLARNKGWATVSILTMALGIGATSAVWSAAASLLLHPLPYPNPNRLVYVNLMPTGGNSTGVDVAISVEARLLRMWRAESRTLDGLEPYSVGTRSVGVGTAATDVPFAEVLPSFMTFAGARPIVGRGFLPDDARRGSGVVLLGESFWQTQFDGAASAIGRTLIVEGQPARIVGVMPATLTTPRIGGRPPSIWVPIDSTENRRGYRLVGRLREGVTRDQAARELDSIAVRSGVTLSAAQGFRAALTSPGESLAFRSSLLMLAGAVLLVLVVAAANVAHLLLARGLARRREIAVRTALGASRWRIARQLMTETFALSALGCAFGAALGYVALGAIVKFRPPTLPELQLAQIDPRALGLVIAASLVCALLFGGFGAMRSPARHSADTLRAGAVSGYSRTGERVRSSLVITEMALSAMLLVGAALLVRTVVQLQRSDLGFDPKNLHILAPELHEARHASSAMRLADVRAIAAAIAAVPGVEDVTITDAMASYRNFSIGTLEIQGRPRAQGSAKSTSFIDVGSISPSYVRTFRARLVEGRVPDSIPSAREVMINEGFARKQWGGASPIGQRIRVFQGEGSPWLTIVGVVHDISTTGPMGDRTAPFLYTALDSGGTPGIVYRTDGREATLAQALAVAKRTIPDAKMRQQVAEIVIDNAVAPSRFIMTLMTSFTVMTLVLAAVGLYGMMAYAVAQRTREIGIRIALGASRGAIARAVVGRGSFLGAAGAILGLILAGWATRIIEGSLYGVSRLDFASFAFGGIGLLMIAVAACIVPTWRAVKVDPMTSIRAD